MQPERWQEIERLYHLALELDKSARPAFLAQACAGDEDLRREVESLLVQAEQATSFLQSPAIEVAANDLAKEQHMSDPSRSVLEIGAMVAHYRLTGKLGTGGMGEVYRARDTKLGRDVALKVLPGAMARDFERMARFKREARALASLNHPNIAAIYDLEESGGILALVMELVEGETLKERVAAAGLVPAHAPTQGSTLRESLAIARQIAEALEYAHERGVIHRDLKPANVKATPEGALKVLDFGLAKVLSGQKFSATRDLASSPSLSTLATQAGMILGTAAYMSPEQAKGQPVDRRCDIWAFGCVLYEMLSGRKAFAGETFSDILAAVLTKEPDWNALPDTTPPSIQKLIRRCLQKDQRQRLQAIGEARIAIEETLSGGTGTLDELPLRADSSEPLLPVNRLQSPPRRTESWPNAGQSVYRFSVSPPEETEFHALGGYLSVSPDGRQLAFVGVGKDGKQHLWIRLFSELTAKSLPGTAGAAWPFWSPDGRYLGFYAEGKLKKVEVAGGPAQTLCEASAGCGTWNRDGVIIFTDRHVLYRVSEAGGTPDVVITPDAAHQELNYFPQFLPDGRHFLFCALRADVQQASTAVGSLDSKEVKVLLKSVDSTALYAPPGYLLYLQESVLMARRFDAKRLDFTADPVSVAEEVGSNPLYPYSYFTVSSSGVLAYRVRAVSATSQMLWFNRKGAKLGSVGQTGAYSNPAISPDGARLAVGLLDSRTENRDIWAYDLRRGTGSPITFDPAGILDPTWSPDGKRIMFTSEHQGVRGIYQKSADGLGDAELVFACKVQVWTINDWSPDGRYALYEDSAPKTRLWALPLFGQREPFAYVQGEFHAHEARFSPNGRYVAYSSDETGRPEVYVQTFPDHHGKWHVSTSGGSEPLWRRDGKELFYLKPDDTVMSVNVKTGSAQFQTGIPKPLFHAPIDTKGSRRNRYAVSPDGRRFLVIAAADQAESPAIIVVVNWPALLKSK